MPAPALMAPPRRRLPVRLVAALLALVLVVAVAGAGAYLLMFNGPDVAGTLVTKIAQRDATAADLLASPATLVDTAGQMGVVGLPGSMPMTIENVKTEKPRTPPSGVTVSGKDEATVTTFTLKASGNGKTIESDESLAAVTHKGDDGKTRIVAVKVDNALQFDAATYFSKGTDEAAADNIREDLLNGNIWLSGVTVEVTPATSPIPEGQNVTPVSGHLTSYKTTVTGTPGVHTRWVVVVSAGSSSFVTLTASEADTQVPVDDQVTTGNIDDAMAIADGQNVVAQFEAAVSSGKVAAAQALVTGGKASLAASGLAQMKKTPLKTDSRSAVDTGTPTVTIGDYKLVLDAHGTWKIDAGQTPLIAVTYAGTGSAPFTATHGSCTSKISFALSRVEFYTSSVPAQAVWAFSQSPKDCEMDDQIYTVKVSWPGNNGKVMNPNTPGTSGVGTVYRYMPLPEELTAANHPITIVVTDYGSPDNHTNFGIPAFKTK